jgi:hypothetical protein
LVFQTPDGVVSGVWDKKASNWAVLDDSYSSGIRDAVRMARKTATADIVRLPVAAPGE